jgi:hypothetical protein
VWAYLVMVFTPAVPYACSTNIPSSGACRMWHVVVFAHVADGHRLHYRTDVQDPIFLPFSHTRCTIPPSRCLAISRPQVA